MDKELIDRYIALPMAINVMKQDREEFKKFMMGPAYLTLLDPAIEKATQDFYKLKKDILNKHRLDIKKISGLKYNVNGEVIEYKVEQLKGVTSKIMKEYLFTV